MSKILPLVTENFDGDGWEEACVAVYRLRYQKEHYVAIPAISGGDAGIEGFTKTGVVHQCYFPERLYSDNELYEHLRNKMTEDIEKLKRNKARLEKMGIPVIREWHFNIPEYRDARIIRHANKKTRELLELKANYPEEYTHIAEDFSIVIKIAEDLLPELAGAIRKEIRTYQIEIPVMTRSKVDWSQCNSEKVKAIRRKVRAVVGDQVHLEDFNELVNIYVEYYIQGMQNTARLRTLYSPVYEELYRLEQGYKNEVKIHTLMNSKHEMNHDLFKKILAEFQEKLKEKFPEIFDGTSITEIVQDMVASWLADCSLEFKEGKNAT